MKRVNVKFWIAAFCLCSAALSNKTMAQAVVASGYCGIGSNLTWVLTSDSVLTISGSGDMYDGSISRWNSYRYTIATVVIDDNVTSIGNSAFYDCKNLTSITIPNSVTSVGDYAFYDCSSLTSVTIGNSVTTIAEYAFYGCSSLQTVNYNAINCTMKRGFYPPFYGSALTTLNIGSKVKTIPDYAFCMCDSLSSVTFGNSVTYIGELTFASCSSLTSITIPDSVIHIGNNAFADCIGLTSVIIGGNVDSLDYAAFRGCSSLISITIPESVTFIESNAFANCTSLQTVNYNAINCTYMGYVNGNPWNSVFYGCTAFTTLNIGNQVKTIPDYAFYNRDSLTSVTIPDSIAYIGYSAFQGCTSLQTINYNAINCTNASVWNGIFEYCTALTTLNIGNNVKIISPYAFAGCSGLTSVSIPENVTYIGAGVFRNCSSLQTINYNAVNCTIEEGGGTGLSSLFYRCTALTTLNIGNNVETIPDYAFMWLDSLTSVTIPENVTSIGKSAFVNCKSLRTVNFNAVNCTIVSHYYSPFYGCTAFTTLNIGNQVKTISDHAFRDCSGLQTVNYNAINCTYMGTSLSTVFYGCTALTTLNIGNNVKFIPTCAFYGCDGLTSIRSKAITPPTIQHEITFNNVHRNIPIYVPCGSLSVYKGTTNWDIFSNFQPLSAVGIVDTIFYSAIVCSKAPYTDKYFPTPIIQTGTHYASIGCGDSVACLTLTGVPVTTYSDTICEGTSYDFLGKTYTTAGTHYDTLYNINGCDSIIKLVLDYYPSVPVTNYPASISYGETYNDANFKDLTQAGTYCDTLENVNGCDSIVCLTLTVTGVGIVETDNYPSLRVYPNPTNYELQITNYELKEGEVVEIYSVVGQRLMQLPCRDVINHVSTIDVSGLASGMYYLKIDNKVVKFVKE